ncbi:hypothetical protein CFI00_22715 [Nocardioides sp. S5]|uniref:hypothetical protein n=1 Tax=Nocardioides sp. S5 TaxID=2017486 RepID=UPI001A8D45B9|nr:hypothetical protein [Nocardioides sp. S5]QSR33270.1 hypothetical protein CFI00_22715 [Nocardioides sp. S5]
MRPLPLMAAGLLAATLLASPSAYAAGETCQGRPATIVGTPGMAALTGTEGADVIVTNGAVTVSALGGDDLVCITGGREYREVSLDAGPGADAVDASVAGGPVDVRLGAGSDSYVGSPSDERVLGGTQYAATAGTLDTERDVITTGAGGDDRVVSGSERTVINTDAVLLTGGGTLTWSGPLGAGGLLDGGAAGGSTLAFETGTGDVLVHARTGTASQGAVYLEWTGFDRFLVGGPHARAPKSFTFVGTERDEALEVRFPRAQTVRQRIAMSGGDDVLRIGFDDKVASAGSTYAGGAGRDHVATWAGKSLEVDLASGRMVTRHSGRTLRAGLRGFETSYLVARDLVVRGTGRADDLRFQACTATVRGRGGADAITQSIYGIPSADRLRCQRRAFHLLGNGGDDFLGGSTGRDLLVGGPGRDVISGNAGRDTCSGEKLKSCEVKRR